MNSKTRTNLIFLTVAVALGLGGYFKYSSLQEKSRAAMEQRMRMQEQRNAEAAEQMQLANRLYERVNRGN